MICERITKEGVRFLRLTGAGDSSAIWLPVDEIRSVSRHDRRPVVPSTQPHLINGQVFQVPVTAQFGAVPDWVTKIEMPAGQQSWVVQESVDEVIAAMSGEDIAEPPAVEIPR